MADETASLILKVDSTSANKAARDLDGLTASSGRAEAAAAKLEQTSGAASRAVQGHGAAAAVAAAQTNAFGETEAQAAQRIRDLAQAAVAATNASNARVAAEGAAAQASRSTADAVALQGKSWKDIAAAQTEAMQRYTTSRAALTALDTAMAKSSITTAESEKLEEALNVARRRGAITSAEYAEAINLLASAKIKDAVASEVENAANKSAALSSRASAEIATAASEIMAGNFGRLRRTGAAFANQAGLLSKLMTPMGLAIVGVSGAVVALVTAYANGEAEQTAFNKALALTGGYAGQTVGQLDVMAKSLEGVGGATQHAAAGVVAQVVQSGKFFGDQVKTVAAAALALQQTTGQAVDKTIQEFEKLGKDPVGGILALNDSMHFLTQATYDQVTALVQRGQTDKAAEVAQDAYASAVERRAHDVQQNLGDLQLVWQGVAGAAKGAWDAMLDIGRPETPETKIAKLKSALAEQQKLLANAGNVSTGGSGLAGGADLGGINATIPAAVIKANIARIQKQITAAVVSTGFDTTESRTAALKQGLTDQSIAAQHALASGPGAFDQTVLQKRLNELAEQKTKALYGVVDPDKRQQIIDAFNAQVAEAAHQYDSAEKKLAPHGSKTNPLSGLQSLVNSTGVSSLTVANNQPVTEYVQTVAKLTTAFDQARAKGADLGAAEDLFAKGVAAANLKLKEQQDQIQQGNDRAFAQFKATLDQQVAAQKNAIDIQVMSVGMGQKEADHLRQLNALDQQRIQQVQRLQREQAAHPEQYAQLQRQINAVNASFADMRDTTIDGFRRMDAAQGSWVNGALAAMQDLIDAGKNVAGMTAQTFTDAFGNMNDALVNFVQTSKIDFSDLAKSIIGDLTRMELRIAESQILRSFLGSGDGAGAMATSFDSNGTFFSFAKGGVFDSPSLSQYSGGIYNSPHLFKFASGGVFGEAGPEAIMPLSRGPDGKLGVKAQGGGGTTVIVENHTDSKAQVQQSKDGNGGDLIKVIVGQAVSEVDKRIARGGSTGQMIQQAFGLSRRGVPVAG